MQNATAAGPSRGLLEVLFGSKPAEDGEADGQGFMSLMNLISSMNGKETGERGAELGRTLRETAPGKDGTEVAVVGLVGMPWMNNPFAMGSQPAQMQMTSPEERERLEKLSAQFGIPVMGMMQAPAMPVLASLQQPLQPLQAGQVNEILREKSLPPLSEGELKLLQDVNGKLAEAKAEALVDDATGSADKKAAISADPLLSGALAKELAQKGIDARKLKATESSVTGAAPEKIVSTEAYLQMQGIVKPGAKDSQARLDAALERDVQAAQQRVPESQTPTAVAGTEQKGTALNARKEQDGIDLPKGSGKQAKLDALAGGAFAAGLSHQMKAGAAVDSKDVFVSSDKPDEMRNALLAEVGTGVVAHAHKGGGEMRLVIHPDDLGEVKLKVGTKNGKVEVQVEAQNEEVAKLIRGGSKELESSLRSQNLSLAKFEVSVSDNPTGGTVASTDTHSNLSDQFFSQSQQQGGLSHGGLGSEGRSAHWGGEPGARQGPAYGLSGEEKGRGSPAMARSPAQRTVRDSSRRLDVVA